MKYIIIISFYVFPILFFGQKIVVTGTVTSQKNGEPLPFVKISLSDKTKGTFTDFDGIFSITTIQNDTLYFTYLGYNMRKIIADEISVSVKLEDIEVIKEQIGPPIRPPKRIITTSAIKTGVSVNDIKQAKKVTGILFFKGYNDGGLPGAIIKNKNTGNTTTSDIDGKFEIAASVNDILIIHFIGMADKEIKVTDSFYYAIYLEEYVREKTRKEIRREKRELRKKGFIIYED